MKDDSLARVGGSCSILLGVSYMLLGIAHLLLPDAQKATGSAAYFLSLASDPAPLMLEFGIAAAGALIAFGAVPAIAATVRPLQEGWVRWTTNLAYLGFAVVTIDSFRVVLFEPSRGALFAHADAAVRMTIQVTDPLLYLDAAGWMGFGGVGLWVLTVSVLALRGRLWPPAPAALGVVVSVFYALVVAGFTSANELLFTIAAVLGGGIAGPIWYIWVGAMLRSGRVAAGAPRPAAGWRETEADVAGD